MSQPGRGSKEELFALLYVSCTFSQFIVFKDDAKLLTNKLRRWIDHIPLTRKCLWSHAYITPKPADKHLSCNILRWFPCGFIVRVWEPLKATFELLQSTYKG